MIPGWTERPAHFASDENRIWLRRRITDAPPKPAVFILYNPSTASAEKDDATSRRGASFAASWGCTDMIFVNLATGIATKPADLLKVKEPFLQADFALDVGQQYAAKYDGVLVAAWGSPKGNAQVKAMMQDRMRLVMARYRGFLSYIRLSKHGYPEHPLYLPGDLKPTKWEL